MAQRFLTVRLVPGTLDPFKLPAEAAKRLQRLRPVIGPASEKLRLIAKKRITNSRDWNDDPFAPLAPSTREEKRRRGLDLRPLIRTQRLRRNIETDPSDQAVTFILAGRARRYASFHLFGTETIPARRFLPVTADGSIDVRAKLFDRWADDTLRRIAEYVITGTVGR